MKMEKTISKEDAINLISKSSVYGNLGLFIGAGMSMAILNDEWTKVALSWKELIYKCAEEFRITLKEDILTEGLSYPEIATEIAKKIAINEGITYEIAIKKLKERICELTSWYPESNKRIEYGAILELFNPNWIITTNYDLIIECLLTGKCLSLGPNDQLISPHNLIPVYHLHGIRTNPNSIIISQEDYISLFRPNEYRQQKLSLSMKESTTLIIGYGLGDVNVLTAVDWTKNVYKKQRVNYPHDIIQLLYTDSPKKKPYRDRNDILIIEFKDLKELLLEITNNIKEEVTKEKAITKDLSHVNKIFKNPTEDHIKSFIDDEKFRKKIITVISKHNVSLISSFLEIFSKVIDETWTRAKPKGAFRAYDENLIILLDIIENIEIAKIPPALLESIAYNLENVSYYIGKNKGESQAAYKTWNNRKTKIPENFKKELMNIAQTRNYNRIKKLMNT
jgi:hypothetical protein